MEILRQIFLGVNYLHHKSIIHRDLKPDNIVFITPLNESSTPEEVDLRIIDFGLAVEEKDCIFKDWANIGTYNFMAP
jgi:serine/threonine protein kinase